MFLADHTPCFKDATIGYGVGSEKAYKALPPRRTS